MSIDAVRSAIAGLMSQIDVRSSDGSYVYVPLIQYLVILLALLYKLGPDLKDALDSPELQELVHQYSENYEPSRRLLTSISQ
jgi:hypothetical protein